MPIYTQIEFHDGTAVIACGAPDVLWQSRAGGRLFVEFKDGGTAWLPVDRIAAMPLHRSGHVADPMLVRTDKGVKLQPTLRPVAPAGCPIVVQAQREHTQAAGAGDRR